MLKVLGSALADIRDAYRRRRLWITLATEDIFDQHRRTTLGPLWLIINYLAFAGIFIFIFHPGGGDVHYPTYVAVGFLVWNFLTDTVSQAVTLFQREASFIRGTTLPLSGYVMRMVLQVTIRTGYALLGCAGVLLLVGATVSPVWLWSLVGAAVVVATAPAVIVLFAFLGTFFPDSQFIVSNFMRVAMFITPVFWVHGGEGGFRGRLYYWNPFTYFLEIVRQPIVEETVPLGAYSVCLLIAVVAWAAAIVLLGSLRRKVAMVI